MDDTYSKLKAVFHLDFNTVSPNYGPVYAVLNGLPNGFQAEVVKCYNDEYGLIQIVTNLTRDNLYVLFHIEETYDDAGIPAIKSSIQMSTLMGRRVDLIARSICSTKSGMGVPG